MILTNISGIILTNISGLYWILDIGKYQPITTFLMMIWGIILIYIYLHIYIYIRDDENPLRESHAQMDWWRYRSWVDQTLNSTWILAGNHSWIVFLELQPQRLVLSLKKRLKTAPKKHPKRYVDITNNHIYIVNLQRLVNKRIYSMTCGFRTSRQGDC